jgi:hypothetical protein
MMTTDLPKSHEQTLCVRDGYSASLNIHPQVFKSNSLGPCPAYLNNSPYPQGKYPPILKSYDDLIALR